VNDTIEHAVRSLPEVLRAAAETHQVVATHTGTVRVGNRLEAVAIWFELDSGVAPIAQRRSTLERFTVAAERDAERAAQAAATEAATAALVVDEPVEAVTGFGREALELDDGDRDPLTGLANRERFDRELENYDSDQAALIVIGVDHYDQILETSGSEEADQVVRDTADRLVQDLRKSDLVARIGDGVFAIVLGDLDRSTALSVSKRVMTRLTLDPADTSEPPGVTATVALAHQIGLVDMEELMESATSAVRSGQRAGGGRLVLGS
jgi:diguanylate cyclase (GGDEF)-like protein